jgi:glutamate synthase (NADPH) large chain
VIETSATRSTLYRPEFEKDNCGFGLIAHMDGKASHWVLRTAIDALSRLTHRGAVAADGKTGDGCGLLFGKPEGFLRDIAAEHGWSLATHFAVGMVFLSPDPQRAGIARARLDEALVARGSSLSAGAWCRPTSPVAARRR